jgi:methylmalonyl-CoA mutase
MYVMTPEYGAATQLEKIDMLDFADIVVINKFDKRGAMDALRDVKKQYQRNHKAFDKSADDHACIWYHRFAVQRPGY